MACRTVSVPWVITCLSPLPMLTVQFGGQHVASLCSMMNKAPSHHCTKCALGVVSPVGTGGRAARPSWPTHG